MSAESFTVVDGMSGKIYKFSSVRIVSRSLFLKDKAETCSSSGGSYSCGKPSVEIN